MKHHHEEVADLHSKHDGGKGMKHHHEHVAEHLAKHDGGMHGHKHHHEEVAKMCGGGMAKGKK